MTNYVSDSALESAREALDRYQELLMAEALEEAESEQRWQEIEECLDSIVMDIQHRCYHKGSVTGVRHIMMLVRRHLAQIELRLLEADA